MLRWCALYDQKSPRSHKFCVPNSRLSTTSASREQFSRRLNSPLESSVNLLIVRLLRESWDSELANGVHLLEKELRPG